MEAAATKTMRTVWSPQPKQRAFLERPEYEVLYGGAAGGGKSDALLAEALRQVGVPHYRAILFRKTIPQLADLIDRSVQLYRASHPQAKYNDNRHCWTFPSGAKIFFGNMQHAKDRTNYQGKAYDLICFDELTHFTWDEYSYMFSRNRPTGPGTRVYMRCASNPGGVGHGWVKARFITPAKPLTRMTERVVIRHPDGQVQQQRRTRMFVPSSVFDNRILMDNDPAYIASLSMLPENERKALLYGDWDSFSGQVFVEWRNDPEHYRDRINTHVVDPFLVPDTWSIYRGFDWGYSRPFSVGWYAVDHDKRLYRIRELYGTDGTPNVGCKWEPARVAAEIARIEREDENLKGKRIVGIADPSIFAAAGSESIASVMARERVYFSRADNERLPGKMQLHNRLAFDERGVPMLYLFSTCAHAIRTLPALVYSERDVEDVDTDGEDHIYDELRYVCMAHPMSPKPQAVKRLIPYSPLDTQDKPLGRYDFFLG